MPSTSRRADEVRQKPPLFQLVWPLRLPYTSNKPCSIADESWANFSSISPIYATNLSSQASVHFQRILLDECKRRACELFVHSNAAPGNTCNQYSPRLFSFQVSNSWVHSKVSRFLAGVVNPLTHARADSTRAHKSVNLCTSSSPGNPPSRNQSFPASTMPSHTELPRFYWKKARTLTVHPLLDYFMRRRELFLMSPRSVKIPKPLSSFQVS